MSVVGIFVGTCFLFFTTKNLCVQITKTHGTLFSSLRMFRCRAYKATNLNLNKGLMGTRSWVLGRVTSGNHYHQDVSHVKIWRRLILVARFMLNLPKAGRELLAGANDTQAWDESDPNLNQFVAHESTWLALLGSIQVTNRLFAKLFTSCLQ